MLVVLARLGNPAMVGRFILGLAIATPVLMFTNMQLRAVLATDAAHQYAFGQYLGLRMLTTLAALPLILLIALAGGHPLETVLVIWVVALAGPSSRLAMSCTAFSSCTSTWVGLRGRWCSAGFSRCWP